MKLKINHPLNTLCLITSCGCNLQCKYCCMTQNKLSEEYSKELQQKTIEALKDGTFLDNVRKVHEFFEQDLSNIEEVSFWGQEPTLTMKYITQNLGDWFAAMPKWKKLFFSTNGAGPLLDFVDLVKAIEVYANNNFEIRVQISHDGTWSCLNQRGISPKIIEHNFEKLIEELNQLKLNKVRIIFCFHGVLSMETMYSLKTYQDLYDYYKEFDDLIFWANSLIVNKNLHLDLMPFVALEQPYPGSVYDGLALTDFLKRSYALDTKDFKYPIAIEPFISKIFSRLIPQQIWDNGDWLKILHRTFHLGNKEDYNTYIFNPNDKTIIADCFFCGAYKCELKIMYDGTVIGCQNYIYEREIDKLHKPDEITRSIKENLIEKGVHFNPLTNPDEAQIEKILDIFAGGREDAFRSCYHSIINLMTLLLETKQISPIYHNKEIMLRHAIILAIYGSCFYNDMECTGSHYLKHAGFIRLFANGFLEFVDGFETKKNSQQNNNGPKNKEKEYCRPND